MRTRSILLAMLWLGCSAPFTPPDGGQAPADSGTGINLDCAPGSRSCEFDLATLATFCGPTANDTRFRWCPPDYEVQRLQCSEGLVWKNFFRLGPYWTCVYGADGGLIGAVEQTDTNIIRHAGVWEPTNCQPFADACEGVGTCTPATDGGCTTLYNFRGYCAESATMQRQDVCGADAGTWTSATCADGGVRWEGVVPLGLQVSCSYADGALVGATMKTPQGYWSVGGQWQQDGCQPAMACP